MNLRLALKSVIFSSPSESVIVTAGKDGVVQFFINQSLHKLLELMLQNEDYFAMLEKLQKYNIDVEWLNKIIHGMVKKGVLQFTIDRNVNILQFRKTESLQLLDRLYFEVTNSCNLKCIHCYNSRDVDPKFIDVCLFEKLLKEAYNLGVWLVDITGGEPFLHPQIEEILELCTRYGMFINLYTNATLFTNDKVAMLESKYRFHSLIVSLDGKVRKTHDAIRGRRGVHSITTRYLKVISQSSIPLRINTMIMKRNQEEVDDIIEYAYNQLNATSVAIAPILLAGRGKDIWEEQQVPLDVIFRTLMNAYKQMLCAEASVDKMDLRKTYCGVFEKMLYVSCDFEVFLCPTLTRYENPEFKLGNFPESSLAQIVNELNRFKDNFLCEKEDVCPKAALCKSGCRSRAYLNTQKLDGVDKFMCDFFTYASSEQNK